VSRSLPEGAAWQGRRRAQRGAGPRLLRAILPYGPWSADSAARGVRQVIPTFRPRQRILVLDGRALAFTRVGWKDEEQRIGEVLNLGATLRLGRAVLAALPSSRPWMVCWPWAPAARSSPWHRQPRAVRLYTAFGFRREAPSRRAAEGPRTTLRRFARARGSAASLRTRLLPRAPSRGHQHAAPGLVSQGTSTPHRGWFRGAGGRAGLALGHLQLATEPAADLLDALDLPLAGKRS